MIKAILILFTMLNSDAGFENQLDNYLQSKFTDFVKYEYEILHMPDHYEKLVINYNENYKLNGDKVYIPVIVVKEGNEESFSHVMLRISLYKFVLFAIDKIDRYADLTTNQFRVGIADVTDYRYEPLAIDELQNKRSRLFLRKDEPLLENMVEEKPVINAGDVIWLNSVVGSVTIKKSAIARQEGRINEIIRVKTEENELFRTKVLDHKNVLVME